MLDGGADLLLIETIFDTLNAKAAIFAIEAEFDRRAQLGQARSPVMISGTVTDASGRKITSVDIDLHPTECSARIVSEPKVRKHFRVVQ